MGLPAMAYTTGVKSGDWIKYDVDISMSIYTYTWSFKGTIKMTIAGGHQYNRLRELKYYRHNFRLYSWHSTNISGLNVIYHRHPIMDNIPLYIPAFTNPSKFESGRSHTRGICNCASN
jgi:hypothetical protein